MNMSNKVRQTILHYGIFRIHWQIVFIFAIRHCLNLYDITAHWPEHLKSH